MTGDIAGYLEVSAGYKLTGISEKKRTLTNMIKGKKSRSKIVLAMHLM